MVDVGTSSPSAKRIGLNAHLLSQSQSYRGAGISGYIMQLLRCLSHDVSGGSEYGAGFHYLAYLQEGAPEFGPDLQVRSTTWNTSRPWQRILWEQTCLMRYSRDLDLVHGLAYAAPLAAACPTVVTVHDLSFVRFPGAFRAFNRVYLRWITRLSARRAAQVIAVSGSTRDDLVRLFGLTAERVTVVHNGVTEDFSPAAEDEVEAFRQAKGLPSRFVLYVGTIEPRKNLVRLVDAYAQLPPPIRKNAPLVIGGGKGWFYSQVFQRVADLGLEGSVIFPGFLPIEELPWWYRAASLFVYPSVFEGFGLPVLEALASGTPVITSNTSSLPEVAGDAAILVDPRDASALSNAMLQVLSDRSKAEAMRELGTVQAAKFSWQRTARETEAVYKSVLER